LLLFAQEDLFAKEEEQFILTERRQVATTGRRIGGNKEVYKRLGTFRPRFESQDQVNERLVQIHEDILT
jgi:hypothetical protein